MKRAKQFVALIIIATLTLGTMVTVFAQSNGQDQQVQADFPDLVYATRFFYSERDLELGVFPYILGTAPGVALLNNAIDEILWRAYFIEYLSVAGAMYRHSPSFRVDFQVENFGQYAVIDIIMTSHNVLIARDVRTEIRSLFFDKSTQTQITQQAFEDAIALAEQEEALVRPEDLEPQVMVPLSTHIGALGLAMRLDAATNEGVIVDADGEVLVYFAIGSNVYYVDGEEMIFLAPTFWGHDILFPENFITEVFDAIVIHGLRPGTFLILPGADFVPREVPVLEEELNYDELYDDEEYDYNELYDDEYEYDEEYDDAEYEYDYDESNN